MDFKKFRIATLNSHDKKFKVSNSLGVYDIYKTIRKNGWYDIGRPLKEKEFYSIIRKVNNLLAKEVIEGRGIVFPHHMGELDIRKHKREVVFKDGKLKIGYVPDWDSTLKLWYKDPEARNSKIILRHEVPYLYHICYRKKNAIYENKGFYAFTVSNLLKRAFAKSVNEGKTDTLW